MRRFLYIITTFVVALYLTEAHAQQRASRDDAVALVKRTIDLIERDGIETVINAINNRDKRFLDRDLYLFVHDMRVPALLVAHGSNKKLIGKNTINLRDQNGKYFVRDLYDVIRRRGSGWVDYRWANAKTKKFEEKTSYVERVGNHFVGVGVYRLDQPNKNTVGIISGNPISAPTYLRIAYDLSVGLQDGDNLRIVPVVGLGGVQNIRDVRSLKGIDIGITQSNILNTYHRNNREQVGANEARKLVYIAKLFTEEIHIIAKEDISSIGQLRGKKVNLTEVGSGTQFTMRDIFRGLGIKIEEVNFPQATALEKLREGEISATILIAGKSAPSVANIKREDGFRILSIPYASALQDDYLPAKLTSDDYPELIEPGKSVSTAAVSAVLIAYNWEEGSDRYRRVKKFVEALWAKIDQFQKPPHHPKWREVNLASTLPGLERFEPMQTLLAANSNEKAITWEKFDSFLKSRGDAVGQSADERKKLFGKFEEWLKSGVLQDPG